MRAFLSLVAVTAAVLVAPAPAGADGRVLVLTRTEGFRHESIPAAVATVRSEARRRGMRVVVREDAGLRGLSGFDAVVLLHTTGDILEPPQEQALERFVRAGGGLLGVHAAADTEYGWPFLQQTLIGGAEFIGHPSIQRATVIVEDRTHPATRHLPRRWTRTDEWYSFRRSPRGRVHVLARIDESTYDPEGMEMGSDHPLIWWRRAGRGRAFYTALGHTVDSYSERRYVRHLGAALGWVAR